jgi:hypothetical protein
MDLTNPVVREIPEETPRDRRRFIRALTEQHPTIRDEEDQEAEWEAILLFDQCAKPSRYLISRLIPSVSVLRQESGIDVFATRVVSLSRDSEESSSDDSEDEESTSDDSDIYA